MIKENGVVIKTGKAKAWVKTIKSSACAGCASHDSCEAAKEAEVEAINTIGAKTGDNVVVGFETGSLIKVSMMLYLFPVFTMIAGAVIGSKLAPVYNIDESVMSAIFAFSFFFLSFICIRLTGNLLSGNKKYQAQIIKIKKDISQSASVSCSQV
ncbi:Putative transcriptional regulator, ResC family [Desulfonema limicola]|uniref:Transcriptional regulator, ResC family n=1 Tax=Desulfonema limicola TaxID=45656 RepID=A0A975B327_9BACT|nr:SoxR reducing system RseC family protein [Desulfonema limicola]QTA77890.1 Putative transcriptional regulator, ResC family [Desulfonema limicola]